MSFLNLPEGVTGAESVFSPIDTATIVAVCPACSFDGEVEAAIWLLAHGTTSRSFEYQWTCPGCELEIVEDREERYGEDED